MIKFGTDGWRAKIADEFTFTNVRIVTQAVADYVNESFGVYPPQLIVGYDNRFLSEQFAETVSEVLGANNIKVLLTKGPTPTPVVAFGIREHKTYGAIMLTASHNPAIYHGLKFIPHYAGPANKGITDKIEKYIERIMTDGKVKKKSIDVCRSKGTVSDIDLKPGYLSYLSNFIDTSKLKGQFISIDSMHGAGINYLGDFLTEHGVRTFEFNCTRDPMFGGKMPEPSDHVLTELKATVTENNLINGVGEIGFALDGDADRFGVVNENGSYIVPNMVFAMLAMYLIRYKGETGKIARTVATSSIIDRIAEKHGLEVVETPVGFKYIAEHLMNGAFIGGEESGGISVSGHVPEKDGILVNLLVAEMKGTIGKSLYDIEREVFNEFGPLFNDRLDIRCSENAKAVLLYSIQDGIFPKSINGVNVSKVITIDGAKIYLENGSWALIRISGTENVVRIYAEGSSPEEVKNIQQHVKSFYSL